MNQLIFEHKVLKNRVVVKKGFKWKVLLFGFFYHAYKGMWKSAIIWLICGFFTCGFSYIIAGFTFYKEYVNQLISDGYELLS